jgi:hypothetical protein
LPDLIRQSSFFTTKSVFKLDHRDKPGDDAGDVEAHRTPLRSHACRVRNTNEHDDIQFFQYIDALNKFEPGSAPYRYFSSVV